MTTVEVVDYLGLYGRASACGWLRRHGIRAVSRRPGPCGQNLYPAELVVSSERRGYDRWCDVEGRHIPDGCRVQQIGVCRSHEGGRARLGQHAVVIGRRCSRLHLRFHGEQRIVSIRPYLVRVALVTEYPGYAGAEHPGGESLPRPEHGRVAVRGQLMTAEPARRRRGPCWVLTMPVLR